MDLLTEATKPEVPGTGSNMGLDLLTEPDPEATTSTAATKPGVTVSHSPYAIDDTHLLMGRHILPAYTWETKTDVSKPVENAKSIWEFQSPMLESCGDFQNTEDLQSELQTGREDTAALLGRHLEGRRHQGMVTISCHSLAGTKSVYAIVCPATLFGRMTIVTGKTSDAEAIKNMYPGVWGSAGMRGEVELIIHALGQPQSKLYFDY